MLTAKETTSLYNNWIRPGSELTAHATALLRARDQRSLETLKLISDIEKKERIINGSSPSGDDPAAEDKGDIIRFEWLPVTVDEQEMRDLEFKCTQSIPVAWYLAPCTHGTCRDQDGPAL